VVLVADRVFIAAMLWLEGILLVNSHLPKVVQNIAV
jgi:hypothetical protein